MRAERNRLRRSIATLLIVAMICSSNSLWVLADSTTGSSNGNSSTESTATASNADADSSDTEEDEDETASDSNSKASDADAEAEEELENDLDFYAMMNIPYADFYAAEVDNDVPVDAFTSATKSKTTNTNLAGGSYHEDSSAILGVTYPVHITAEVSAELDAALEVEDEDDLFGSPSYSWYNLNLGEDETPDFYKEVTLGTDGYEFGEVEGDRTSIEGSAVLTTETSYGDYQLDVTADQLSGTVNGIVIHTDGHDYGLRHLENYWKPKNSLAWCTGFTTSVHNCPTSSEHYESMMGETIIGLTYYTTDGIYEIDLDEIYVPIIADAEIVVEDASVTATYTSLTISGFPSDFEREYAVYNSDGDEMTDWEVTESLVMLASLEDEGTTAVNLYLIYGENVASGLYTLSITDAGGTYAAASYEFNLYVDDMPVAYDAEIRALVASSADAAEGTVETYVSAITSVEVDGASYSTGRHGTTIINSNGSVARDAAPLAENGTYEIVVHATGYQDYTFTYTAEDIYALMNIPYAEFYAAEGDADVDAYSSATLNKSRTMSLAGGSYHVDPNGTDITGSIFPVKVDSSVDLTEYTRITDDSSVEISVTNRGTTSTNIHTGSDALFESDSYSYYLLSETPSYYKEVSVGSDDSLEFGEAVGTVRELEGTFTVSTTDRHVDYAVSVEGISDYLTAGTDKVSGVTIKAVDGTGAEHIYGLRHVVNIWRVSELGWDAGEADGHYDSLVGSTIQSVTYYTEQGIYTVNASVKVPSGYVLMNIPYAEFYEAEGTSDVDAYSSATTSKPLSGSLAGGSYHVNADGTDITGAIFPVKLTDGVDLSNYTQITDESSVTITTTNRGQTSTTTYTGSDALFESDSYSYYVLSETPSYYKEVSVDADGSLVFGATVGEVTEIEATAELSTGGRHTYYEISVDGITDYVTVGTDQVYGVTLTTSDGTVYGLRHVVNIWRVSELGWDADENNLSDLVGKTITGIKYFASTGIYEINTEVTVPVEYVLMNIPYAEFYEAEGTSDVDAYSSATTSKPLSGSLAGGSYHVNADGTDITGVIFPVKLGEGVDLSDYTQITDASSVTITTTNRGQTSTTTYTGSDALFESDSYSYYVLSETPSYYKEVSVDADGNLVFGAAVGEVTEIEATAELSTGGRHTYYELSVDGITDYVTAGTDQVYGVTLTTSDGTVYGLRHVVNIWRVSELGWDADENNLSDLVGKTITGIKYFASTGIYEINTEVTVPVEYVLMNIPYAEFYEAEGTSDVDAYSSATTSKPLSGSLAGGSYHVNADGTDITGVIFPVKLGEGVDLSNYTQITDASSVTITTTNRGQTSTTTYTGSDALFESDSYSYYVLSEMPSYYKEVSVAEDGSLVFGAAQGTVTTVTDASLTYTDTDHHVDHALTVGDFDMIADDTVYGVVLHTATANYGLRHVTNIWRVYYLGWNNDEMDGYYDSLVGDYVTSVTYYTSSGIYELTFEDGVYVGNVIIIDGVEVITDALYNEDGSIDLSNTELFSEGEDGAYLVTVGDVTQLVGDTTLKKWVGSYENWQSWIYPTEEMLEQYPYLEEAWDLAYEAYIAAFEAYGMGDYIKAMYPDTDSLKAYWYSMTDTYGVEYMEVEETADGSYVLSWLDADGNVLASDGYTMTGIVLNGLEGAKMYVFTADNLEEGSRYKYWVTMEPDMEGTTEFPIAAHFHFQYGSDIESLLVYGQTYNETTKNIADTYWYATMIDADAEELAKYNVILGMHLAEKWNELPEEEVDTTALEEAIETAEALTESDYTSDSWEALEAALAEAADVLANATTQDTIDAAADALNAAIDALVRTSGSSGSGSSSGSAGDEEDTIDTSELKAAIANAEAKTQSRYTASTWSAMQTALAEAKEVLAAATTQDEIDAATAALNAAIDALRTRSSSGGSSGGGSGSGSSSSGSSSSGGSWQHDDDGWWYRYTDGSYPKGAWARLGSQWYYFDGEGYACRGWQRIDGSWYYLDPTNCNMLTGWHQDPQDGRWYYLNPSDGRMLTGWQQIDGVSYFFNSIEPEQPTWTYSEADEAWNYTNASDRPFGSMYANEATPDGYQVDVNGAWIP